MEEERPASSENQKEFISTLSHACAHIFSLIHTSLSLIQIRLKCTKHGKMIAQEMKHCSKNYYNLKFPFQFLALLSNDFHSATKMVSIMLEIHMKFTLVIRWTKRKKN